VLAVAAGAERSYGSSVQALEGDLRVVDEGASCELAFRRDLGLFLWGCGITKERAIGPAIASIGRQLGWRPAEVQAVERGLARLRADGSRRGGTPLPAAVANPGR
jgi:hypothetical protein